MNLLDNMKPVKKENQCKGLYFRGYRSQYFIGDKFESKVGVRLLKKKSCKGCECCGGMLDSMKENINNVYLVQIEDGEIYTPIYTNISRDWETGYIDDYDIEFIKVSDV